MNPLLSTICLTLLVLATLLAAAWWRARADEPPADWYPDPAHAQGRRRWDGQAWREDVQAGPEHGRGHHFRGRFWGRWILAALAGALLLLLMATGYRATGSKALLAVTSAAAMACFVLAFLMFVGRQQAWRQVVSVRQVAAVLVAGGGAAIVVAGNVNDLLIRTIGLDWSLVTVGLVEEATKLAVPLLLFAMARYRNPRAGIAIGLASAGGFAIAEAALYAVTYPSGGAPNPCTGATVPPPGISGTIGEQVSRILLVEPLHLLWTGMAVAVVWRLWHVYGGVRWTPAVIGALLLPVVLHSANDSSARLACDGHAGTAARSLWVALIPIVSYVVFRALARLSTPPLMVEQVSRGWRPKGLAEQVRETPDLSRQV